MPLRSKVMMGPIEKYKHYSNNYKFLNNSQIIDRFPWKLLIHVLLLILTSAQIIIIVDNTGDYSRVQEIQFLYQFLDSDTSYKEEATNHYKYIFNLKDLQKFVEKSIQSYYSIESPENLEEYGLLKHENAKGDLIPIPLNLESEFLPGWDTKLFTQIYNLTDQNYGPFNLTNLKDGVLKKYVRFVQRFQIRYKIREFLPQSAMPDASCYQWIIIQKFEFEQRSTIRVDLDYERESCFKSDQLKSWNRLIWIHLGVIFFGSLYIALTIKYIIQISKKYNELRTIHKQNAVIDSDDLSGLNYLPQSYNNQIEKLDGSRKNSDDLHDEFNLEGRNQLRKSYLKINGKNRNLLTKEQFPNKNIRNQRFGIQNEDSQDEDLIEDYNQDALQNSKKPAETKLQLDQFLDEGEELDQSIMQQSTKGSFATNDFGRMMQRTNGIEWNKLGLWEKAKLFNKWSIVSLISNIFLITGTVLYVSNELRNIDIAEVFLGFGSMLCWVSFSRYLESSNQYTFVNRTMRQAMPVVMRAMVGIIPFFVGFAFLGLCLFWETRRFNCPSTAFFTLFAMMNGDSLTEIHSDLSYSKFLIGNLFMYIFVFISICVIQNVFITIVEDGYLSIKYKSSYDWLSQKYDQPHQLQMQREPEFKDFNNTQENDNSQRRTSVDLYNKDLLDKLNERFKEGYFDEKEKSSQTKKEIKQSKSKRLMNDLLDKEEESVLSLYYEQNQSLDQEFDIDEQEKQIKTQLKENLKQIQTNYLVVNEEISSDKKY
eukprot:403371804